MKGKIIKVDESTAYECTVTVATESGETFKTSFDKRVMINRYSTFKHRYGTYPEDAKGVELSVEPPCKIHGGKIDILANR